MKFQSDLEPFDKVVIDGDESLVGTVISFQFRPNSNGSGVHELINVAYIHNGQEQEPWIERRRLTKK